MLENPGIDPGTSHMRSGRSTIEFPTYSYQGHANEHIREKQRKMFSCVLLQAKDKANNLFVHEESSLRTVVFYHCAVITLSWAKQLPILYVTRVLRAGWINSVE